MAIRTASITVGTTPTDLLFADDTDAPAPGITRTAVVSNVSTSTLHLGGPDVTASGTPSDGIPVAAGATFSVELTHGDTLFAVATVASEVRVMLTGL